MQQLRTLEWTVPTKLGAGLFIKENRADDQHLRLVCVESVLLPRSTDIR